MFLCLICARFALLKTGHSNRNLTKKGLRIESFLQKTQKLAKNSPIPPSFEKFSLDTLNSKQKPSVKNRSTGPVRNRSTGDDFEIYRSGRVEKILTGSISGLGQTKRSSSALEVESRTQGSRPSQGQKKFEAKAKDSLSEDRPSRGQGQECSRPRPRTKDTAASVSKKKGLQKSFSGNLQFIGVARIFYWREAQTTNHMQ